MLIIETLESKEEEIMGKEITMRRGMRRLRYTFLMVFSRRWIGLHHGAIREHVKETRGEVENEKESLDRF